MRNRIRLLTAASLLSAMFATLAIAQTATATLKGGVTDSGGQITPGVTMTLTQTSNFKLTETSRLQFRAEAFNLFNRTNFTIPSTTLGAVNFGQLINAEDARQLQFALKLYF